MDDDWIHCNKCFRMKITNDITLYLSQCQHIFCKKCLQNVCPICGVNMKVMKIDSSMPANMRVIFEDFEKGLERINKTMKFQWMQRSHLEASKLSTLARHAEVQKEIKRMKKGLILLTENANKEKYKLSKAKEHLSYLMRYESHRSSQCSSSTPQYQPGTALTTPVTFKDFTNKVTLESTINSNISLGSTNDSRLAANGIYEMQDRFVSQKHQCGKNHPDQSVDSGLGSCGSRPKHDVKSAYKKLFDNTMD